MVQLRYFHCRFAGALISIDDGFRLLHSFSRERAMTVVEDELGLTSATVVDWFARCRLLATNYLSRDINRPMLGGVGLTVECDESAMRTPKHHRGHPGEPRWVFGLVCRETGDVHLEFVKTRDKATLHKIIRERVAPGSTICTDGWRAYRGIEAIPVQPRFVHAVVNHSLHFTDPATGANTNKVEAMWSAAKKAFQRMNGVPSDHIQSHLDEWLFRRKVRNTQANPRKPHHGAIYEALIAEIRAMYDVNA